MSDHGELAGALRQNTPRRHLSLPSLPQVIELIAGAGFDFAIIERPAPGLRWRPGRSAVATD